MAKTRAEKRAYWADHAKNWKVSGESKRSYARLHNLRPDQLGYWIQVFEAKPQTSNKAEAKRFVAVSVTAPSTQSLTIKLPSGLTLEGIHSGNLDITRVLIRSLV